MNITLLTNHFNTGGITSYLLNLSKGLVNRGHKIWVVSAGGNCVDLLNACGAKHVQVDIKIKSEAHPKLWFAIPTVAKLLKTERMDIMHAHTRVTQVMAAVLSRNTGIPCVSTCHGYFKPRIFRRIFPCWGKAVIAISAPVQDHLIHDFHLDPARVSLIANGIDVAGFKPVTDEMRLLKRKEWDVRGTPVIGIIARLSSVKGIDVLINAVPKIKEKFPNLKLCIIGEGPEEDMLKRLANELNLSQVVDFKSIVNRTADILPVFDVFVMPSLQEGLGLSVLEAQAAGIPVVASNVGGLPDLIANGKTGLLVESNRSDLLADTVIELLSQPQKALQMAQAARAQVELKFSLETMINKTISFYEQNTRR